MVEAEPGDDPGMVRAGAAAAARRRELNVSQRSLAADGVINAGALIAFEKGRSWPRERTRAKKLRDGRRPDIDGQRPVARLWLGDDEVRGRVLAEGPDPGGRVELHARRGRGDRLSGGTVQRDRGRAVLLVSLELEEVRPVQPFPAARDRELRVLRKTGSTPARFPRRPGMAL